MSLRFFFTLALVISSTLASQARAQSTRESTVDAAARIAQAPEHPRDAAPPRSRIGRFQLRFGVDATIHTDERVGVFTDEQVDPNVRIGVGYDFADIGSVDPLIVSAEVELMFMPVSQNRCSYYSGEYTCGSNLRTLGVMASSSLRWELTNWFVPRARVGIGLADIETFAGVANASGISFQMQVGVGFELLLVTGLRAIGRWPGTEVASRGRARTTSRQAFGLLTEVGYTLAPDTNLTITNNAGASRNIAFGTVNLGGPFVRISGVIRF